MTAITLGELAVRHGLSLRGSPDIVVSSVATLEHATPGSLAFLANQKYRAQLATTQAAAVVLDAASADLCPVAALVSSNPYLCYARIAAELHPAPAYPAGVHPSAVIDATATIDASAHVAAHVFIGAGVKIGARAYIGPGCVIEAGSQIGADSRLIANVTLCRETVVGERCLLNPSCVLGADGFGFAPDKGAWVKVPQLGRVCLGNDVEVGASTTIDRGAIGDTVIDDGVKLDNQIQIAHNVHIGAHTAIAAFVGISGSTTIGQHCMIAGQVGIAGHLSICDGVVITGKSMVSSSICKPGVYSGALHATEAKTFRRNAARFAQLDELAKTVRKLVGKKNNDAGQDTDTDTETED